MKGGVSDEGAGWGKVLNVREEGASKIEELRTRAGKERV